MRRLNPEILLKKLLPEDHAAGEARTAKSAAVTPARALQAGSAGQRQGQPRGAASLAASSVGFGDVGCCSHLKVRRLFPACSRLQLP